MKSTNLFAAFVALAACTAAGREAMSTPPNSETIDLEAIGVNADFEDPGLLDIAGQPLFLRENLGPGWTAFVPDTNGINYGVHRPRLEFYNTLAPLPFPFEGGQFGFLNMDRNGVSAEGVGRGAVVSDAVTRLGTGKTYRLNVGVGARYQLDWSDITYEIGLRDLSSGADLGTYSSVRLTPGGALTNIVDLQYTLDVDLQAPGYVGRDVGIVIRGINQGEFNFTQMNFDNVRLTVADTPTSPMVQLDIPGTANPWLAGMIDATMADRVDSAPLHSPVLAAGLNLQSGILHFAATGAVTYNPLEPLQPPDGNANVLYTKLEEHGKSRLTSRIDSLVGVFLDDSEPAVSPPPNALDFTDNFDFHSLSPELKQPFFVGDGRADDRSLQDFHVPAGATRLFLGTHDGFDWRNNLGTFQVTVWAVPEPASLVVLVGVIVAVAVPDYRRRRPPRFV
jgi:HpiC1 cyclase